MRPFCWLPVLRGCGCGCKKGPPTAPARLVGPSPSAGDADFFTLPHPPPLRPRAIRSSSPSLSRGRAHDIAFYVRAEHIGVLEGALEYGGKAHGSCVEVCQWHFRVLEAGY